MTYRLHVDIPLDGDEDSAIRKAKALMDWWTNSEVTKHDLRNIGVDLINYRLGHDDDRQKSNYLIKTDSGHVTNKKCKVDLSGENA